MSKALVLVATIAVSLVVIICLSAPKRCHHCPPPLTHDQWKAQLHIGDQWSGDIPGRFYVAEANETFTKYAVYDRHHSSVKTFVTVKSNAVVAIWESPSD